MPRVSIYDAGGRVAPAETTKVRFQNAPVGGVARGIAEGLSQLGGALGNLAETAAQIERQRSETEATDAGTRFAEEASRLQYDPETGFLTQKGRKAVEALEPSIKTLRERANEVERGLSSPAAKRMYRRAVDERIASYTAIMQRHAAIQHAAWQDDASDAAVDQALADAVNTYVDPDEAEKHLLTAANEIRTKGERAGEPVQTTAATIQKRLSETRTLMIARMAKVDPAGAESYRKSVEGLLFGPDALRATEAIRIEEERNAAEARRIESEKRQEAARQAAIRREEIATRKNQLDTGAGTPADWRALAADQRAIGDTSAAVESEARATEMQASDAYRGATLGQIDQRIGQLEAARRGKGGMSPAQAAELNGLRSRREQTHSRLNQPGGALLQDEYASGRPPTALSERNPSTFEERGRAAIAAAKRQGGAVEPLLGEELRVLGAGMNGNANARLRILRSIALFRDPRAIEGAARQLSTEADGDFRIAASLIGNASGDKLANEILRGRDALAVIDKAFDQNVARGLFARNAAPALAGMAPDYARDVFDAAKAIYAERARQQGVTSWNEELWRGAVNGALGGEPKGGMQYGGIVRHRDGQGVDRWVSIPPGWTGDGVFRRIQTMEVDDLSRARVSDPGIWPDGSGVYTGQLREMTPVRLGGTRYGFLTRAGRLLGTRSGGVYTIDVAKLPWKR